MKKETNSDAKAIYAQRQVKQLIRDAMRYRAIKEKIDYSKRADGMTWAHLEWCVDVHSLSPVDLDEAIDELIPPTNI